ncbi:MAG: hypothetical protein HF976_13660 [ANME-2 cluster archaeon]|nr:hypothetical protein [ANME-2 cluster archaeon]MBC2708347.1 hypothetical protein [ANME-2 cluster archaeon]
MFICGLIKFTNTNCNGLRITQTIYFNHHVTTGSPHHHPRPPPAYKATGRITLEGSSSELLDNNHVKEAYLGM